MKLNWRIIATVLLIAALTVGCDKNEDPANPNDHVNSWILENLQFWYYWNSSLPTDPNKSQEPEPFFNSLLNSADRFSWIQDNYKELLNSLQGISKEPGFEYALYRVSPESNSVIAHVLYVKPNSPAASANLKRGDIIDAINSQSITTTNYKELIDALGSTHTLTYRPIDIANQTFGTQKTITLTPVEYSENPNYLNKVFTYNDRKIGYYVYNFFAIGATQFNDEYNTAMDAIFAGFKSENITDLIVDLRFNSGGAEKATVNLASLIGKDINNTKVFTRREYNPGVTDAILKDPSLGEAYLNVKFTSETQNVGSQLRNGRVYILTGSRSASASELLVNGLRPYMDVFLIGNKTVGKNMGSISLYDEDDAKNTWGMQPLVTKSFNSLGQSDYDTGFTPQVFDADNSLFLYPLGDPKERLLSLALKEITGLPEFGRTADTPTWGEEVGHSLDSKPRSNRLILDIKAQKPGAQ